jgi:hypothetical protein
MNRLLYLVAVIGTALFLFIQPALAEEPTAEDYIKFHEPFLGAWKATVEVGGEAHVGTARWELAKNKKCFLVCLEVEGLPAVQVIMGYDPATKKWTQAGFDSDGTCLLATVEFADMRRGNALSKGQIGKWEKKRLSGDGATTFATETFSCTEMSKDRIVLVWSNRREQGKSLPDWKLTYERPETNKGEVSGSADVASPALAQESNRDDFREFCQAWQGRWVGNVTWITDQPGAGKKGEKVTAYSDCKLVDDGGAMIVKYYGGDGSATWLIAFDAGAKRITGLWITSGGLVTRSIIYRNGDKWIEKGDGSYPDGTKTEFLYTITISDGGNTHTWTGTTTVGGKKVDELHDVYRRVSNK